MVAERASEIPSFDVDAANQLFAWWQQPSGEIPDEQLFTNLMQKWDIDIAPEDFASIIAGLDDNERIASQLHLSGFDDETIAKLCGEDSLNAGLHNIARTLKVEMRQLAVETEVLPNPPEGYESVVIVRPLKTTSRQAEKTVPERTTGTRKLGRGSMARLSRLEIPDLHSLEARPEDGPPTTEEDFVAIFVQMGGNEAGIRIILGLDAHATADDVLIARTQIKRCVNTFTDPMLQKKGLYVDQRRAVFALLGWERQYADGGRLSHKEVTPKSLKEVCRDIGRRDNRPREEIVQEVLRALYKTIT